MSEKSSIVYQNNDGSLALVDYESTYADEDKVKYFTPVLSENQASEMYGYLLFLTRWLW